MSEPLHPAVSSPLPSFVTAPSDTDALMVVMAMILVLFTLMIGTFYFRLHALPDRFAHQKVQFEIVCVLGLIAMFTHMHIFWIAGLLLALIDFPDFTTPLNRIARSTEKIASTRNGTSASGDAVPPHGPLSDHAPRFRPPDESPPAAGDRVVLHPSDRVTEGTAVAERSQ